MVTPPPWSIDDQENIHGPAFRQFERDLQERQLALRALFVNEEVIREHERTSLSRDIHDVLGQMLTAHKMDLHWMKSRGLAGETESTVNEMLEHMDEMIQFVKRVCSELRDSVLDDFGFDVALDEHLKQFKERSKTRVEMNNSCGEFAFDRDKAVSLLRIIQEALTNITRHAQASTVTIGCRREGDLMVCDVNSSLGIVGMNERAAAWGGQVEITSVPGSGTTVRVEVPLDHQKDAR